MKFGSNYYGGMNPYFALNPSVAGVNHGIIYAVELVMAIKTIAHRILQIQSSFQRAVLAISVKILAARRITAEN